MASTVAETLITEFQLDASKYVAGSKQVIAANAAMMASMNQLNAARAAVQGSVGGSFGTSNQFNFNTFNGSGSSGGNGGGGGSRSSYGMFGGFFGAELLLRGIREVEQAFVQLAHKFLSFSEDALNKFAEFDTIKLSFEGIYGSSQKAAQMMNYLKDVSITSAFQFKDLADAARGIAVAGLDVNRFLPIVQGFSLAMGHINGAGLQDIIGILRRIQGGNTGLALGPRGIGRYGVSRAELEMHGGTFDAKGHFTGSVNQAFDAIEAVFKARFAAIAEKVTASSEVVISNWKDAIYLATVDAGAGIAQNLIGPIKTLTSAMNTLRQSGAFKSLFDDIYQIIGLDDMIGDNSGRKGKLEKFDVNDPSAWMKGMDATKTLIEIGGGIVTLVEFTKIMAQEMADVVKLLAKVVYYSSGGRIDFRKPAGYTPLGTAIQAGEDWKHRAYSNLYRDQLARQNHPERFNAPTAPGGNAIEGLDDNMSQQTRQLKGIHEHVKNMDNMMKATAFGGGDIGRYGVTPVERSEFRIHGHGNVKSIMESAGSAMDRAIQRMIQDAFRHGLQQGMLTGRGAN